MRKFIWLLILAALISVPARAQVRVLAGAEGGIDFSNESLGVTVGVEAPFAKRYELDLRDTFSPVESHISLGAGTANKISATGIVWLNKSFGLNARVEDSRYSVTQVEKRADYAFGGIAYRTTVDGFPTRIFVDYVRQFNNGVSPAGIETSHLQGVQAEFTFRLGCTKSVCFRVGETVAVGRTWAQGNQACDGSTGPQTCGQRNRSVGGQFTGSFTVEFPRPRGKEYETF